MTEQTVAAYVPDDLAVMLADKLTEPVSQAKRARFALDNDPAKYLVELRETSTDPIVVKLRDQIELCLQKIDEHNTPLLQKSDLTPEQANTLLAASVASIKSVVAAGENMRPGFAEWVEVQVPGLADFGKVRRNQTNGTVSSGIAKPHVKDVTVDSKPHDTFSLAAKSIEVNGSVASVKDMHDAWVAAANVPMKDIKGVVEFEFHGHKVSVNKG